ncbi:alpha/beta fold hydrolase [Streptomyces sp. CBMA29]|uniref:alpha/beta fold hydrolase n=1 Tax=Streptomyces sp. CBMA29 TaxID=1896314 RepID=UPI001661C3C5|nr:alpha/beta fold hydrolase [Streptomyces sp. CBMA29]MBD0739054.1 alpha/beta hydrolase [Streptomyces sp. CBMA29]
MTTPNAQHTGTRRSDDTEAEDLHVCQDGFRDAPALLLIHGSAASTRSWDALVPLLTGSHHVIRVDLLGHGRSPKPLDADYSVPAQARRVARVLDRLGVARAVVVGHSSGGYTATALAEQRPDLVTALALVNTGPSLDAFLAPEAGAEPPALDPAHWPPTDDQIRGLAASGFREGYDIPDDLLAELRAMTFRSLTATMGASTAYLAQLPLPARLMPLGTPLLVLFGDQDRRWRAASAADYLTVPHATVNWLPGLGHSPLIESPPQTAAQLLPFTTAQPT